MKRLVFLSMFFLSLGCAQQSDVFYGTPLFSGVDPQIQPFFNYFTAQTGVPTTGITAGFTVLPSNLAGECVWGGIWNEVRINSANWSDWTTNMQQQLISHELGHCALFLQHINNCSDGTTAPDGTISSCNEGYGMPLSIMNWQIFDEQQANSLTANPSQYYQYLKLNQPIP